MSEGRGRAGAPQFRRAGKSGDLPGACSTVHTFLIGDTSDGRRGSFLPACPPPGRAWDSDAPRRASCLPSVIGPRKRLPRVSGFRASALPCLRPPAPTHDVNTTTCTGALPPALPHLNPSPHQSQQKPWQNKGGWQDTDLSYCVWAVKRQLCVVLTRPFNSVPLPTSSWTPAQARGQLTRLRRSWTAAALSGES